jgi:hypothetical protein
MYAVVNIPGSGHFTFFGPASRDECRYWLCTYTRRQEATELPGSLLPQRIVSNREFESWRWADGTPIYRSHQYNAKFEQFLQPGY